MAAPSALYKALGWTGPGPLFSVGVSGATIPDAEIISITTHRGGSDPSKHTPSTGTLHTTRRVGLDTRSMSIDLSAAGAAHLAALCYTTASAITIRMYGRRGAATAHDHGRRGWTTTEVTAASWDSVLKRSPDAFKPSGGSSLSSLIAGALNPTWAPALTQWSGTLDLVHETPTDPMTAADALSLLEARLYFFVPTRDGRLIIRSLEQWETMAAAAATTAWPLSRSHVLAPTTWEQPADSQTEYRLQLRTTTGTTEIITAPTGTPSGTVRLEDLDWLSTRARTEQWRRVYGLRAATLMQRWSIPQVTIRLDKLIASERENDRRSAGLLLGLEVGDPIGLSGDWPTALSGMAYVSEVGEQITHAGWTMTLGLTPYAWLAGQNPPTAKPRTWAQTRLPWGTPTETWQEGPAS